MNPIMRNLGIAACCASGLLLGLLAAYVYYVYRTQPTLTFEKEMVDLRGQTTFEGEVIRLHNSLINHTSRTVVINGISTSCGCLAIRQNDEPLSFPIPLAPNDSIPLDIKIYTQGRFSEQLVAAEVEAIGDRGEKYECSPLQIAFTVTSRVVVIPDDTFIKVEAPDKKVCPVHSTFLIASRGEPCTKITIETAHKERFKFDVKKANATVDFRGLTLSKCFDVELSYLPVHGAQRFSEMLQFIPDDQPALAKTIRFDGVIEYPYGIEPERLAILRSDREIEVTETAVYRYRDNEYCTLHAKTLPKGFRLQITDYDQHTKLLTFYVNREKVDWEKTEDKIVFDLEQGGVLEIPVKKIRLD